MKKIILIIGVFLITNILFSQNEKKLIFKVNSIENVKTSTLRIYYVFSDLFYEKKHSGRNFYIYISNKRTNDSAIYNVSYIRGVVKINGISPGCTVYIKAIMDNKIISDTVIVSDSIKLIYIEDACKLSFGKKFDFQKDNIYFVIEGPLLTEEGNFFGSYCERGILKKNIKMKGNNQWIKNNGIIGVLSNKKAFLFNGIDPYHSNEGINYYNTGINLVDNKVVLKQNKKIIPISWFIQNGPIIIQDGRVVKGNDNFLSKRAALCFDGYRMYYAIDLSKVTISEFSRFLIKKGIDRAVLLQNVGYSDIYGEYGNFKKDKKMKIIFYK